MRRACWLLCLGLGLSVLTPLAIAQPKEKPSKKDEKKAKELIKEADAYFNLLDFNKALSSYKDAYLLSTDANLLYNIAQCHYQLGQYEEALRYYENLLREVPNTPHRAEVEASSKEIKEMLSKGISMESVKKAEKLFGDAEGYYNLQQYDAALKAYEEAYLLSKESALLFNIGQCYRLLGRYEEALKSYNAFVREFPEARDEKVDKIIKDTEAKVQSATVTTSNPIETPKTNPIKATSEAVKEPTPPKPKEGGANTPLVFYGVSAASGATWLISGGSALFFGNKERNLRSNPDDFDVDKLKGLAKRTKTFAAISDASLGVALLSGGAAYFLWKEKKATAAISPWGVTLAIEF